MHTSELPPPPEGMRWRTQTETVTEMAYSGSSVVYTSTFTVVDPKGEPILEPDPDYIPAVTLDDVDDLEKELDQAWAYNRQVSADLEFVEDVAKREGQQRQIMQDEIDRLQRMLNDRDSILKDIIDDLRYAPAALINSPWAANIISAIESRMANID